MQCPNCLCSLNQEIILNSVKFLECDWCRNLITPKKMIDDPNKELEKLRLMLKDAGDIVDSLIKYGKT